MIVCISVIIVWSWPKKFEFQILPHGPMMTHGEFLAYRCLHRDLYAATLFNILWCWSTSEYKLTWWSYNSGWIWSIVSEPLNIRLCASEATSGKVTMTVNSVDILWSALLQCAFLQQMVKVTMTVNWHVRDFLATSITVDGQLAALLKVWQSDCYCTGWKFPFYWESFTVLQFYWY